MNSNLPSRIIQNPDSTVTGRSVVQDDTPSQPNPMGMLSSSSWPYALSDYLQGFVGKMVQVKYIMTNGKACERKGILIVSGSNFIGIQPNLTADLFLIELSLVKCVNVINYQNGALLGNP